MAQEVSSEMLIRKASTNLRSCSVENVSFGGMVNGLSLVNI